MKPSRQAVKAFSLSRHERDERDELELPDGWTLHSVVVVGLATYAIAIKAVRSV